MIFRTLASLYEFRGLGKFATFIVDHETDSNKHYYCQFFIDEEKYKDFKFIEGKDYELTLAVSQAKQKTATGKFKELTRSSLFLREIKEVDPKLHPYEGYGDFKLNLCVLEKKFMATAEDNTLGVYRFKVVGINDTEWEYPFYIWDFARFGYYDTLKLTTPKHTNKYTFACFLFNKTHYDENGVPSTEAGELLDNGKNKWYTEIKINYSEAYEAKKVNPKFAKS